MEMTTSLPRAAVLLATYNGNDYLQEQLDSIVAQTGCDIDIWVSDDQSVDGTWERLQRAAALDGRIRLLPRAPRAGSAAANFFRLFQDVDLASYDFIALADQDDVWFTDKMSTCIAALRERGASAVSSDVVAFWRDGRRKRVKKSYPQRRMDFLFESAGQGCTYVLTASCACAFRDFLGSHVDAIKGISFHDWLLYAWARSHGHRWHIVARPTMLYRQHGGNVLGANTGFRALFDRFRQSRSGWYRGQILRLAELNRTAPLFTSECATVISALGRGSLVDRLVVASKAGQLRRRVKDRLLLAAACISGAI